MVCIYQLVIGSRRPTPLRQIRQVLQRRRVKTQRFPAVLVLPFVARETQRDDVGILRLASDPTRLDVRVFARPVPAHDAR